jgi:hypothetical protein
MYVFWDPNDEDKENCLLPCDAVLGKQSLFIVGTIRTTQIHCVGRMQSFGVLKQVVHIVTDGL